MTLRGRVALGLVLPLAACSVPVDACQRKAQSDLLALDRQIDNLTHDIMRGHSVSPAQLPETRLRLCAWPKEPVLFCTETIQKAEAEKYVLIDAAATARDVSALHAERAALAQRIASGQGTCP